MANTTNYNWETPDDTDLVKDGAAAIRTLGSSVDTTTKALNPSTTLGDIEYRSATANTNTRLGIGSTGQVLTVAGGVPTWATSDDANAIQNALLTTTGDTIYASGASTPARLGIGSTGNVLTVAGGVPTWAAPAGGGGMTLLSTTTLSGASITLNSFSGYNNLQLIIRNFKPATDGASLRLQVNADSGSNRHKSQSTVGGAGPVSFNATNWLIAEEQDDTTATGLVVVDLPDYANSATWKAASGYSITNNAVSATDFNSQNSAFYYNQTAAITSLLLFPSAGNFTSGTALLYGVK